MNIVLLPDLVAMVMLLTILHFLRRRHLQEGVGLWIIGLLFIFLEALAYAFYKPSGPRHIPMHVLALDSYLAAGVIFLWAASSKLFPRRATLMYLWLNAPALAAVETAYAFDLREPKPYHLIAGFGLAIGLFTPFLLTRSVQLGKAWSLIAVQIAIWVPVWVFASANMFRDTAYFPLFVLYLSTAFVFGLSLPRNSLGRVAIITGFTTGALVFLAHSWVSSRPQYADLAKEVWDWQKFLVTIGMLLVLLERQVSTNEWFALHDQLTGLPNRRCFEDKMDEAIKHAQRTGSRAAVIMIDLNGFKTVNDTRGHDTGDLLLQDIARNLRQVIRSTDILARLGGDEFIIVATNLPNSLPVSRIVEITTTRVVETLARPFSLGDESFTVGGSVGVAVYPDDTTDEVLLRRLADQRMYQQKRQIPLAHA
ncbi:diguanylate cyclase [Edaphobacter modestus]|uniref:Diguanylate cyclase (GGDEF)-like protein n=1 Tax=Edaphobacter modestus TaxID=388466 RepID=A0A4Q7YXT4_9BACT|nr:diguanylate cyclase [Edaphobacter modestus]RZU41963.1 diguanylate cyclase (GGDEF)-like protein [Edaphobacter modestus]